MPETTVKAKPYISQSQLQLYEMCAEAYRRSYIENDKRPPGFVMVRGTAVHKGSQENFKYKIKKKKDLRERDIVEIAACSFDTEVEKGVTYTDIEKSIGLKKVKGEVKDQVVLMAHVFAQHIAPKYDPLYVEQEHRIVIPDFTHDLLARMDLCDTSNKIVDLKTSSKAKSKLTVKRVRDCSEQGSFYALVYKAITGKLPKAVVFENLITTGQYQTITGKKDMQDLGIIIARINQMTKALKAGIFMPTNSMNWKCNPAYCGYWADCPYTNK